MSQTGLYIATFGRDEDLARILILDGHCAAALAFVRSLGRAGHWVAVGSHEGSLAPAALSRYCACRLEYPFAPGGATPFVEWVLRCAREHSFDLVIPMTDFTILPLSQRRQELSVHARCALPGHSALELVCDKYRTVSLARQLGIPTPETVLVNSMAELRQTVGWPFPIVVKDRFSIRWIGERGIPGSVAYACSRADLEQKVESRLKQVGDVLVQQFAGGMGLGFASFAANGEIYLPFEWKRIREGDPRGSGSSARKSVPLDPQLLEYSRRLVLHTGLQGISMVEFKKEKRSGRVALMEINGRPWGSMQLPIHCGVDYPQHLVNWCLESRLPPKETRYTKGITCRWLAADLVHLRNVWAGKPAGWPADYPNFWSSLLKVAIPWYPGLRYDDLSWTDPRPGLAGLTGWFRTLFASRRTRARAVLEVKG